MPIPPVPALLLCLPLQAPSPAEHLGRPLAADFELADWREVSSYFHRLAAESPRVATEVVGRSTEGRDFLLCAISSEANLARLAEIREAAAAIADPRGLDAAARERALARCVPILMISNAMHSTETAAPQFAMRLAFELATSPEEPWRSARERLLVLILPCTNPDGLDRVVEWYRSTVGTPHESSGMIELYQRYAGHDNNRDWFMLSLDETRIVTRLLYSDWHPHVYWDVHQQGSSGERMFVPPFRDPLDPNLDPGIIMAINLLGTRAQLDMTRWGKTGVASGGTFDMWWNGGNRNVPVRHNIVGLLTEAASVRLASPIFQQRSELRAPDGVDGYRPSNRFPAPWPGGWWRLVDIVDYEMAFARSLLGSLARERRFFLENALEAADRCLLAGREGSPRAWILPADQRDRGATRRLVDVLLASGIEMGVAQGEVHADGRAYPAGSIVIRREQPYGAHVKDLFEVQRYPPGDPPYDVAGWTLPELLGVRRVEVVGDIDAQVRPVTSIDEATAAMRTDARAGGKNGAASGRDSDSWASVFSSLQSGQTLTFATYGDDAGVFTPGTGTSGERDAAAITIQKMPRVGLFSPWTGNMDEGWTRWVFDTWGVAHTAVRNEMLRAGALSDFLDVLVLPGMSPRDLDEGRRAGSAPEEYTGGLDPEGAIAVEEFVRGGGTLVAIGASTRWAIDLMDLPVVDVAAAPEAKEFSCPGSVLRAVAHGTSAFTSDLDDSIAVFFSRGQAFRDSTDKERAEGDRRKVDVLLRYAPTRLLISGWIQKPEAIEGRGAWVRVTHGAGAVHLFGFRPQYRGWSQSTFPLLFRAILFDARGISR